MRIAVSQRRIHRHICIVGLTKQQPLHPKYKSNQLNFKCFYFSLWILKWWQISNKDTGTDTNWTDRPLGNVVPTHASTMQRKKKPNPNNKVSRFNLKNLTGAFVVLGRPLSRTKPFPIDIPLRNNYLKIELEVTGRNCRYECRRWKHPPNQINITHINPTKWTRCRIIPQHLAELIWINLRN